MNAATMFPKVIADDGTLRIYIPSGQIWQIDADASVRWHATLIFSQVSSGEL